MNPVQSLQHMLNHLARTIPGLLRLRETGVFDESTLEAVMIFQRDNELPVTGIVDQDTWDTIRQAYFQNLLKFGSPPPLHVFRDGTFSIPEGSSETGILIAQAIFTTLNQAVTNFETVELNGRNSGSFTRNLRRLQALSHISETGTLDRHTWAILSKLYRALIPRNALHTFPL